MSIVLVGSTSGSCTLQEQAVAGTTVLTLPTTSGTVLTTASSGQSIPKAALPTGSVLQVVNATNNTGYSGTTGAETALFNFSITPQYSSSKIAIFVSLAAALTGNKANYAALFRLRRGTTTGGTLIQNIRFGQYQAAVVASREIYGTIFLNGLDSPATTSSQSYCITIENQDGTPDYTINGQGQTNIIFMEIAA
jgi:hypothetical protein